MKKYLSLTILASLTFIFAQMPNENVESLTSATVTVKPEIFKNHTLPYDAAYDASDVELALFAWETMIALNWKSSFDKDNKRDNPDTDWSYQDQTIPETVVWETFAHRVELRPTNTASASDYDIIQGPMEGLPNYTFGKLDAPFKLTPAPGTNMQLWNCLDEDNEIGSCVLFETTGDQKSDLTNLVLYQAKLNKAAYDYRRTHYNNYESIVRAAERSRVATRDEMDKTNALVAKNVDKTAQCETAALANSEDANSITKKGNGAICLPCGYDSKISHTIHKRSTETITTQRGVIEIKTAWRKLKPTDDRSQFLIRKAIYFPEVDEATKTGTADNGEFALIGMHINAKTANYPSFLIATFEHLSVPNNYKYVSKPGGDNDYQELYDIHGALREHDYLDTYDPVTKLVHNALGDVFPSHYLNHYRLAGVQGHYEKGYASLKDRHAPSFFLSNYVIESDYHLANFYGNFAQPQIGTQNNFFNTINRHGAAITTGGCKGCHGVAQIIGFDMSFVLDENRPAGNPDAAIISLEELNDTYFGVKTLIENSTAKKKKPIFLSLVKKGKPMGYLDKNATSSSLIVNDYEGTGYGHALDVDGNPRDNFQFVFDEKDGTVTLEYISLAAAKDVNKNFTGMPIVYNPAKKSFSAQQFPVGEPAKFTIQYKDKGIIALVTNQGGKTQNVVYDAKAQMLIVGKSGIDATEFQVYGYDKKPYGKSKGHDIKTGAEVYFTIKDKYILANVGDPTNKSLYAADYNSLPPQYTSEPNGGLAPNFKITNYDPNTGYAEMEYIYGFKPSEPLGTGNLNYANSFTEVGVDNYKKGFFIKILPSGYVTIQSQAYTSPKGQRKVPSKYWGIDPEGPYDFIFANSKKPVEFAVNYVN